MWITRVWNPLSEFPDLLQVLQEKVRQNVIWGYENASPLAVHFRFTPQEPGSLPSFSVQVLVQVHERDRYGHSGGVFACMGPGDGPIRAPDEGVKEIFL